MYNTAILLAVSPGKWTFQEKHIQHCYILGHNNGAYEHFTKRKIMYNTAILLVLLLTRRMNFSIHDDAIYSQWRLHHFILLAYKTILVNLERWWMMMWSIYWAAQTDWSSPVSESTYFSFTDLSLRDRNIPKYKPVNGQSANYNTNFQTSCTHQPIVSNKTGTNWYKASEMMWFFVLTSNSIEMSYSGR